MQKLTERQQKILTYIQRTVQEKGYSPSIREIASYFTISGATAYDHVDALRKKKYLEASDASHRSFRLTSFKPTIQVPVLGQVRAGVPILAEENIESYLTVDREVARGGTIFALRVVGDSMKGAGILDKDTIIIRKQETAQSGQIVVAVKDEEATVKYLQQRQGQMFLEPANPAYKPIPGKGFSIIGTYVGLIRRCQN